MFRIKKNKPKISADAKSFLYGTAPEHQPYLYVIKDRGCCRVYPARADVGILLHVRYYCRCVAQGGRILTVSGIFFRQSVILADPDKTHDRKCIPPVIIKFQGIPYVSFTSHEGGAAKKSKEQQNAKNPVDNRTSNGEDGKAGVPDKGDRVDAAPVENGNERGNKERRKRQDPEIHDKRFP